MSPLASQKPISTTATPRRLDERAAAQHDDVPLVVDLEGTLVTAYLTLESIFILLKKKPLRLLRLLVSSGRGLAWFKHLLAKEVVPDVHTLPYNAEFLAYLKAEKQRGRKLILATGADEAVAHAVAAELGLFDAVFASDGSVNLSRDAKRTRLIAEFGERGFDYAGQGRDDRVVWQAARKAVLVSPTAALRESTAKTVAIDHVFEGAVRGLKVYPHALRLHHWIKNALVFVPLIAAHDLYDLGRLIRAAIAFIAFGLCASSIYLLNDLMDLSDDRLHPRKRQRMLASGRVPLGHAVALLPLLLIVGLMLGALLPLPFTIVLGVYYVLMVAYCFRLRGLAVVDALVVAAGYGLRVIAGAVASGLAISAWQTVFCFLFFFGLTLLKRYGELTTMHAIHGMAGKARAYLVQDKNRIAMFGCSANYLALLVFAFYIDIDQRMYPRHEMIWFVWVLMLYWVSYMWLMAGRGRIDGDPVAFALKDRVCQIVGIVGIATLLIAI